MVSSDLCLYWNNDNMDFRRRNAKRIKWIFILFCGVTIILSSFEANVTNKLLFWFNVSKILLNDTFFFLIFASKWTKRDLKHHIRSQSVWLVADPDARFSLPPFFWAFFLLTSTQYSCPWITKSVAQSTQEAAWQGTRGSFSNIFFLCLHFCSFFFFLCAPTLCSKRSRMEVTGSGSTSSFLYL